LKWRSPEEYFDKALTERVDVFSLGNNMYSLLTGLWPFYDENSVHKIQVSALSTYPIYGHSTYLRVFTFRIASKRARRLSSIRDGFSEVLRKEQWPMS